MNVRFIDTSVMANMLKIPGRCNDAESVQEEFKQVLEAKEVLILPIATIIETGNHIAHIADSNARRSIAGKFGEYLRKTAEGEAPWQLYGIEIDKEGLLYLADHIEENASQKIGMSFTTKTKNEMLRSRQKKRGKNRCLILPVFLFLQKRFYQMHGIWSSSKNGKCGI